MEGLIIGAAVTADYQHRVRVYAALASVGKLRGS